MKKTAIAMTLTLLTLTAQAAETVQATTNKGYDILDSILGTTRVYSQASEVEAKVFEVLAGDGMNATRMLVVLADPNTVGISDTAKVFELGTMMVSVRRVVFSAKDELTINYTQDDIDVKTGANKIVNKSLKIKIQRDQAKHLSNVITVQ